MTDYNAIAVEITKTTKDLLDYFNTVFGNTTRRCIEMCLSFSDFAVLVKIGRRKGAGEIGINVTVDAPRLNESTLTTHRYKLYPLVIISLRGGLRDENVTAPIEQRDDMVGAGVRARNWRPAPSRVSGVRT